MGIEHITFMGGTAPGSGLYTGNTPGIAISPFSNGSPAPLPGPTNNYLVAQPGGAVNIHYDQPQTAFTLLWGSVDTNPGRNVLLSGPTAAFSIDGALVMASLDSGFMAGVSNAAVSIALTGGASGHIQTDDTLPPWLDALICCGEWEAQRYHLFEYDH